jgi:uncharacterized coiled-coil protein SlyX
MEHGRSAADFDDLSRQVRELTTLVAEQQATITQQHATIAAQHEALARASEQLTLLKKALWRPTELELFVMDREGRNLTQVTKLTGANFAPSWHPDGKRLIFSFHHKTPVSPDIIVALIRKEPGKYTFTPEYRLIVMTSDSSFDGILAETRNVLKRLG